MRRSLVALVPVAVSLFLTACDTDRSPSGLKPGPTSLARPLRACDFTKLAQDGKSVFVAKDPVLATMIGDMKAVYDANNKAPSTEIGFDILSELADRRREAGLLSGTTAAITGAWVDLLLGCMDVGTAPSTFNAASALAGIFEVRGGTDDETGPALAWGFNTGVEAGPKRWGVESKSTSWTLPAPTNGTSPARYLVFGYPITSTTPLAGETAVNTNFVGFELGTLPDAPNSSKSGFIVGYCDVAIVLDANNKPVAVNRLIHSGAIVPNQEPAFCSLVLGATASRSWFASVASQAFSLLSPKPLYAEEELPIDTRFIGGGPSGWSPHVFGQIVPSNATLTFTTQPRNTVAFVPIPEFVVQAKTAAGNGIPDVAVTVSVSNNQGIPAGAEIVSGTLTVLTDANGDAKFGDIAVGKAGGYTVTVTGVLDGAATLSKVSSNFQVKNGK